MHHAQMWAAVQIAFGLRASEMGKSVMLECSAGAKRQRAKVHARVATHMHWHDFMRRLRSSGRCLPHEPMQLQLGTAP